MDWLQFQLFTGPRVCSKSNEKRGTKGNPRREKQGTELTLGLDNQLLYNLAISQTTFREILN